MFLIFDNFYEDCFSFIKKDERKIYSGLGF